MLRVLGHTQDSVDFIVVDFWDLMGWHVFDIEVVFDERISHDSGVISNLESLGEFSWVLIIEQDLDSMKSALFFGVLPVTFISFRLKEILLDLESSPVTEAISVCPKTLCWNLGLDQSWHGFLTF